MISFRALAAVLVVGLLLGSGPAWAQASAQASDYVVLEFVFGLQGALLGGGAGFYATYFALSILQPCPQAQPELRACELGRSLLALVVGPNLGIPPGATFLGVGVAGALVGVEGNLWLALVGSIAGTLVGSALAGNWVFEPTDFSLVVNPVTMAALGATIGYNIGAKMRRSPDALPDDLLPSYEIALLRWRF
ncbi:MAG: hypothetical protein NZ610_05870 [Candidatus Bipolaricaulota bacterium]|nr:hypothetical protein [Candidatus Bipolaricaulota bacterium]MCS7274908.1 hypothetical protein [Candidatus Bipolaricaulota bacterium]MDW8110497.1 hypothetical protein [Candidatus Bipolaricaulota bacterium]MDW8329178.1 hypothetical protein [Candidatus Bipolaricaulota bacterium]